MNEKVLKTLEYHKIISLLTDKADSEPGKKLCRELLPSTDIQEIRKAQEAAVKAAEQPAPASPQEPPQKATESPTAAAEWTITIIGDADIEAARAWVEMFGINYREE